MLFWICLGVLFIVLTIFQICYWGIPKNNMGKLNLIFQGIYVPWVTYDRFVEYKKLIAKKQSNEHTVHNKTEQVR